MIWQNGIWSLSIKIYWWINDTLNDNPNIVIELGSHTDTRDNDKANEVLSFKRAQSVIDYLVSKGIAGDRMTAKGYGEKTPLISDKEIATLATNEEKEAAHQKNFVEQSLKF